MLTLLFASVLAWGTYASDTDLKNVLSGQPSLSKFTSLLTCYSDLLAAAQAGDTTSQFCCSLITQ